MHPSTKGKTAPGQIPLFDALPLPKPTPRMPEVELVEMANQLKGTNHMKPLEKTIFVALLKKVAAGAVEGSPYQFEVSSLLAGTQWLTPKGVVVEEADRAILTALEGLQRHIARLKYPVSRQYFQGSLIGDAELDLLGNRLLIWVGERFIPSLKKLYEGFKEDTSGVMDFNSFYSQFFYKFFQENKHTNAFYFPIKELREALGIKSHEYKRYNDFKRCVLLRAQPELAKHGYLFEFWEERGGRDKRKYVGIHFLVKVRSNLTSNS